MKQITVELHWKPFRPSDWRNSGSCYPCLIWDTRDDMVFTICDPWTLPPDNDFSSWLCVPTGHVIGQARPNGTTGAR